MLQSRQHQTMADVFNNLRRIYQALNEQSKMVEKSTGLTGPQLWAILTISREAPIRVSNLAELMFLHPATVVGILNRLEDRGLIVRKRNTQDRRAVLVELTDAGKEYALRAPAVAQGKLSSGLSALTRQELEETHRTLDRLVKILDAQAMTPKPIR